LTNRLLGVAGGILFFGLLYLSNGRAIGMVVVRLSVRPSVRL